MCLWEVWSFSESKNKATAVVLTASHGRWERDWRWISLQLLLLICQYRLYWKIRDRLLCFDQRRQSRRIAYVNRNCRFKLARSIVSISMMSISQKPISAWTDEFSRLQQYPLFAFTKSLRSSQPSPPAPMIRIFTDPIAARIYSIATRCQRMVQWSWL